VKDRGSEEDKRRARLRPSRFGTQAKAGASSRTPKAREASFALHLQVLAPSHANPPILLRRLAEKFVEVRRDRLVERQEPDGGLALGAVPAVERVEDLLRGFGRSQDLVK
jgi:hypothetical protein